MPLIELAGFPVVSGHLTMPLRGPWSLDGKVDSAEVPAGRVELACEGGLHLSGTVDVGRSGIVLDAAHLWVVGGAGGLGRRIGGAYRFAQLRDPVNAILAASGESLSSTVDPSLLSLSLPQWSIASASCSSALTAVCTFATTAIGQSVNWRVLSDGTIWIGAETWPAASLDPTDSIAEVHPSLSCTVVSVQVPTIAPGSAVEEIGNVAAVEHWIDGTRGVRSWLYTDGDSGSSAGLFRRNVRVAIGLQPDSQSTPRIDHLALYPARVDAQASNGSTVDVTPLNPLITPHMLLPLRVGTPGEVPKIATGTIVRVGWDEGDPSKMFAIPAYDQGAHVTKLSYTADEISLNSGQNGAARRLDALSASAELVTWAAAVEAGISSAGGTPPPTSFAAAAGTADKLGMISQSSTTVKVG